MIVYAIIMFLAAGLIFALGISVYKGNTKLIHDYHQTNIQPSRRQAYGRAFAKGMGAMSAAFFASGTVALLGDMAASYAVLAVGRTVSMIILVMIQKKYNGGLF